jgi:hypothetical protein
MTYDLTLQLLANRETADGLQLPLQESTDFGPCHGSGKRRSVSLTVGGGPSVRTLDATSCATQISVAVTETRST